MLTKHEKYRLRGYNPGNWTDGLFDRNFCRRMEVLGLLAESNSCMSGERYYGITEAGQHAIADLPPT